MEKDAYKDAGVDIEAGNTLVTEIKPLIKQTHRAGVMGGFGGFGSFFDPKAAGFKDPIFVSGTDGVGTKLKVALEMKKYDTVGIDLVAMCVNDLLVQGAEPLWFLDYFACGSLDIKIAKSVISGIAKGCELSGCALIGGETAEMPGMYSNDDFDLAGFSVGAVERENVITGDTIKNGDVILGLTSSGVHSNGFSLVRKLVEGSKDFSYQSPAPYDASLTFGEALLVPTRLYVQPVLKAIKETRAIQGMSHITGGGLLENIPRILPKGLGAELDTSEWDMLPIFKWLQEEGNLSATEMGRTFNCGIGFVIIVRVEDNDAVRAVLEREGESVFEIGHVVENEAQTVTLK